jgi:hypothetical protein
MTRMRSDVLIGTISGYDLDAVTCWLNSLDRCGFAGRRVMLAREPGADLVNVLVQRGFEVLTYAPDPTLAVHVGERRAFRDEDISVERFFFIWRYLSSRSLDDFRYAIAVDVRDAIFQQDPSAWLSTHLPGRALNVSSEGLAYGDEEWNGGSLEGNFGTALYQTLRDRVVFNAGVIAGEASAFRDFCLNVYLIARSTPQSYSDQAAMNILLGLEPYRSVTRFSGSEDGWACHAGTMADPALLERVGHRLREPRPVFDGRHVYTAAGQKYVIVHQYDRVPEWQAAFHAEYSR